MNWPPLTAECSSAVGDAIRDVVNKKPKDLFEHVAQLLQDKSGMDPTDFEEFFEECRRRPRTYVLEDRCPPNQDPLAWVPMRYNDDTILLSLQQRSMEIVEEIMHEEPISDIQGLCDSMVVTYPELMYMRDSEEETLTFQTVKAIYLGSSGYKDVAVEGLDDADPRLAFRCESLCSGVRSMSSFEALSVQGEAAVEALIVCSLLRVLGRHEGFVQRYGGGIMRPEMAILHAIEKEAEVLPSYQRLGDKYKALVVASLQAFFPLEALLAAEVTPAHFGRAKDALRMLEGGMGFFATLLLTDHMVSCRNVLVTDEEVDLARLSMQCLNALEKYGAPRAYELFLKKRAEKHAWRVMKDEFFMRTVVRLCCMAKVEETSTWENLKAIVQNLAGGERNVLEAELGRKDGITEVPVFALMGAGAMMARATANEELGQKPAVRLLAKVLLAAGRAYDKQLTNKIIRLHFDSAAKMAKDYRPGSGAPFEETPFQFQDLGGGDVKVNFAGVS